VAQIYIGPTGAAPVALAEKSLVAFERVELEPGHAKRVTVHVAARGLSYYSVDTHQWELAVGARALLVGSSSRDIRVSTSNATAPVLTVPSSFWVRAPDNHGAVVTYATSAVGVAGTPVTVTCSKPSGSTFRLGLNRVNCAATDGGGNTSRKTFFVLVTR
jgi:Fibronectin type III-like domain/HYR domain